MEALIVVLLLVLSAVFSGLNLGLMSLGPHELKRKMRLGDKDAKKIYPVRARGNYLLVTILVSNVAINSTLAIFLGSFAIGIVAVAASTMLITVFGEIIPQAIFSRYALVAGAKLVWLIKIFMFVLYPVCAPITWILDKVLGEELPTVYSRKELVEILQEHSLSHASDIQGDEERIASGALTFGHKLIKDVMTPRIAVLSLLENQKLDPAALKALVEHGHTRYPVLDEAKEKVVGILYVHQLVDKNLQAKPLKEICDKRIFYLHETDNLDTALRAFLKTRHHLFIVIDEFAQYIGVISLEDVLEEILGAEIVDEFDEYEDMRQVAKRAARHIVARA
jgi:metal transporter CNNM